MLRSATGWLAARFDARVCLYVYIGNILRDKMLIFKRDEFLATYFFSCLQLMQVCVGGLFYLYMVIFSLENKQCSFWVYGK